jgi:putative phage-type endonuclease
MDNLQQDMESIFIKEKKIEFEFEFEFEEEKEEEEEEETFIDNLEEEDLILMENEIYHFMDNHLESNIIEISNPLFYKDFISTITDILYDACSITNDADTYINSYDELLNFVQIRIEIYLEMIIHIPRSYKDSFILNKNIDIDLLNNKLSIIRNSYQPQQRTDEWYDYRHRLLTASNIGKILGSTAKKNSLIYEKCKPLIIEENNNVIVVNTLSPLHWGVKYEPVSILIYEHLYSTQIEDFGCIKHSNINCLGASPDGINIDITNPRFCRMIEVKNIVNREITGIPLEAYWIQMQIQMEVCNLDECDFIETRIKEYDNKNDFLADSIKYKGIILYFLCKTSLGSKPFYKYMPIGNDNIDNWINQTKYELKDTHHLYDTLYWYLDEISCILVPRNKLWFNAILPHIEDTWNIILKERVEGYDHRMPKKRIQNENNLIITKLDYLT